MTLKSLILNVVLVAVSVAISAAAVEYGTRLLFPALAPSGQIRFIAGKGGAPTLGPKSMTLRQVKNAGDFDVSVTFNKYGLRDSKNLDESRTEDYFLVGDSLSLGWGVEENERYSNILQDALKRPVFNLCIPGTIDDFIEVVQYAEKNGAKVKNLLLAISMASNLTDYEEKIRAKQNPVPAPSAGFLRSIKPYLMNNSAFYFLVTSFIHKNARLRKNAVDIGLIIPSLEGIAHKPYSPKVIESTAQYAADFARQYDTIIVIAPSRALWFGTEEEKMTARRIHKDFVARLRELDLRIIDIRPAFEAEAEPLKNYFVNDGHWSPQGHAAAAKVILEYIK